MQNLIEADGGQTALLTAEQLREVTATKEDIFKKMRANVLDSLMGSMVTAAQNKGATTYSAALGPDFTEDLLKSISEELTALGYTVLVKRNATTRELFIDWTPNA